ncbi:OmpA family protein [Caballeronia sp. GAFFF2]|uniref:OmpA family protein n=1 Tax=Caballeronia sp. GAFFF2 TaxID=2921741 RepID=UPI002028535A|nr:OmpA family protein [Caballeronia sp. GAFFF2]
MSINIFQILETVLNGDVIKTLSAELGIEPDLISQVTSKAAPALVAALTNRASTTEGARHVFAAIASPEANGQIASQISQSIASPAKLAAFEAGGRELIGKATGADTNALAEAIARHCGTSPSASLSLCGVVGAALMGILKQHFTQARGSVGQLPTLLGHQLPEVHAHLTDHIASVLGLGTVTTFGAAILSKLKDVSAHFEHPQSEPAPLPARTILAQVKQERKKPTHKRSHAWLWWLLALAALVLAIFALRSCNSQSSTAPVARPEPASNAAVASTPAVASAPVDASAASVANASDASAAVAASAPAATQDARVSFTVDITGMPTVTATVGSEAEKAQLLDALTKKFGEGKFTANITVDPATKPADWLTHLDGLLPLMAVPGAEVKVVGSHVELGGSVADVKAGWLDKLKALFGSGYDISVFNVQQAVASATQSFRDAVKGFFGANASCANADVAKLLNLQVINFATGKSMVPVTAAEDLRQSAKVLKTCAKSNKAVQLEVAGYSDNVGTPAMNLALSRQRAQAVRSYLVAHGVPGSMLNAQGYGEATPVDSNDTESGRFHNRRIEFLAK